MDSISDRLARIERRKRRTKLLRVLHKRNLKDYGNPLEYYDSLDFKLRFHMYKETALFVSNLISEQVSAAGRRKGGIQLLPIVQFLICLRFMATGSFQIVIGDLTNLTQPSVSRIVRRVSKAIASHRAKFIQYPTFEEATLVKESFYQIAGFPGVVGVVDGCHVSIKSPGGNDAELFRNRKGSFSINVQGICDADLAFTNIVSRWYGSAHDSRIFLSSSIGSDLEDGKVPGILLGDSGYPLLPYLMVPLKTIHNAAEGRYQSALISTRNAVERGFGVWKNRFPCLKMLRLKLNVTLVVIVATAILHNICRRRKDIFENDTFVPDDPDTTRAVDQPQSTGIAVQKSLIDSHFS